MFAPVFLVWLAAFANVTYLAGKYWMLNAVKEATSIIIIISLQACLVLKALDIIVKDQSSHMVYLNICIK